MRFLLSVSLAIAVLLTYVSDASAQFGGDDRKPIELGGFDVEAALGWGDLVDPATPVPVSFLFSNYTNAEIDAELFLVDHQNGREVSLGNVFLSQDGRRRLSSVHAMTNWFECFAELRVGREVIWRRELPLNASNPYMFGVNYALVINDSGRAIDAPQDDKAMPAAVPDYYYGTRQLPFVAQSGRPVEYIQVKTWQVPTHPGPMLAAAAVIFPEGSSADDLNRGQWQAVADWMCQGGNVFVHNTSQKVLEQLRQSSHLSPAPPVQIEPFAVHRAGIGSILVYSGELFDSVGSNANKEIAAHIAIQPDEHIGALVNTGTTHRWRGGQAEWNRILVVGFFVLYAFLSGFVGLLLFRRSRRFVAIYIGFVVAAACISAVLLGGFLRMSRGDLRMVTVTQAGPGGAVQVGKIEVQSAGARNTQVAAVGSHVDLQYVDDGERYSRYSRRVLPFHPFTFQKNLQKDADGRYQVDVPMPPWGRRRLQATAFSEDVAPIDISLRYEPARPGQTRGGPPNGQLKLQLKNKLPYVLKECVLVFGYAGALPQKSDAEKSAQAQLAPWQLAQQPEIRSDMYLFQDLGAIDPDETRDVSFPANFRSYANRWEFQRGFSTGQIELPGIARENSTAAWLIARIEQSPIIQIDEDNTEFISDQHLHLFMQRVDPDAMPAITDLIGSKPGP